MNFKNKFLNAWSLISFITSLYITLIITQTALSASFPLPQVAYGTAAFVLAVNTIVIGYKAFSK